MYIYNFCEDELRYYLTDFHIFLNVCFAGVPEIANITLKLIRAKHD